MEHFYITGALYREATVYIHQTEGQYKLYT